VRELLDRAKPIIATLWEAHTRLQKESAEQKTRPHDEVNLPEVSTEIQVALTDFTGFCERLNEHKLTLGKAYEDLLVAQNLEELLGVYLNVAKGQTFFDQVAGQIRISTAGRELHDLALSRLQTKFLRQFFERLVLRIETFIRAGAPQELLATIKDAFTAAAHSEAYRVA
jgi:hypothetical protein